MLKVERDHDIYEIINLDNLDRVLFSNAFGKKPNQTNIIDVCVRKEWGFKESDALKRWIKENIRVRKAQLLTNSEWIEPNPAPKSVKAKNKCSHCNGWGWKTDDSYSSFGCPWCNGTGYK